MYGGWTSIEVLSKIKMKQPPATGQESYQYLTSVWQQENILTSKNFLRWYNNKDVAPTLEVLQKMVDFSHNKRIDMLKLGCTLPNIARSCLHKSTVARFYPFTEIDKDFLEKIRKDMFDGPSIDFTRRAVVEETFFRIRQTGRIDGSPLSELMLASLILSLCVMHCQLVCTQDWNQIRNLVNLNRIKTRRGCLKTWSCHFFSESHHSVNWKVSTRRVLRKKLTLTVLMVFVDTATLCLDLWGAIIIFVHLKNYVHLSLRKKF